MTITRLLAAAALLLPAMLHAESPAEGMPPSMHDTFVSRFEDPVHIEQGGWTFYDGADGYGEFPEIDLGCGPGMKAYALGKIKGYRGVDIYVVRLESQVGSGAKTVFDEIVLSDGEKFLPTPAQDGLFVGRYTVENGEYDQIQAWRFDQDTLLHVRTREVESRFTDQDGIPYIKEWGRTWRITPRGCELVEQTPRGLYCPETYDQFKMLCSRDGVQFAPESPFVTDVWKQLNPNRDELYAEKCSPDTGGLDLFFFYATPRSQEPWSQGDEGQSGFLEIFTAADREHRLPEVECLGSERLGDAVGSSYDYRLQEDGSLVVESVEWVYGPGIGFGERIEFHVVTTATFRDAQTEWTSETPLARSAMFDAGRFATIEYDPKYPTPDNPCWFWRGQFDFELGFWVEMVKGKACFCFVSRTSEGEVLSAEALCPKGITATTLPAVLPSPAHPEEVEFVIETGNGRLEVLANGTLYKPE